VLELVQLARGHRHRARAVERGLEHGLVLQLADVLAEIPIAYRDRSRSARVGLLLARDQRKTVVLPAPFGPTRPIFSPRFTAADASRNRICAPWRFETASMRIRELGAVAQPRGPRAR
jgi:hypothetical protein